MNKTIVTKDNAYIGMKVVRGRDWKWRNQGGSSKFGTITDSIIHFPLNQRSNRIAVKWDNGVTYEYRIKDHFDLYVYEEEFVLPEKWCVDANSVVAGKWFNSQSGRTCYSNPTFLAGYLHSRCSTGHPIGSVSSEVAGLYHHYKMFEGFTQITIEQFKKYVMKETSETVTLSVYQMKEIVNMACNTWKSQLMEEFWEAISTQKEKVVTKKRFQEYLDASTQEQKERFKELFPEQFKVKVPNIKPGTLVYVKDLNQEWKMRYFHSFTTNGTIQTYHNQKVEGDFGFGWLEYSLTNPLEG